MTTAAQPPSGPSWNGAPQPGYPQVPQAGYPPAPQGWVQPYGPYGYGVPPRPQVSNGLAIASMVLGIVWVYWLGSLLAVVFGHVALSQIKRNPYQGGKGMAIAGLVLGYIGIAILVLFIIGMVAAVGSAQVPADPTTTSL